MNSQKMNTFWRKLSIFIITLTTTLCILLAYKMCLCRVPDSIYMKRGTTEELNYHIPASGKIIGEKSVPVSLNQKVTLTAGEELNKYRMELKLFGVIPFKNVDIQVIETQKVIPAGIPIGIYVKTKGVLIIDIGEFKGMDGIEKSPSKYILQPGDYILAMDGMLVNTKNEIVAKIKECKGNSIMLTIKRNKDIFDVSVQPSLMQNGEYKIGAWLRDSAQGIGTMTYIDEENRFGALGHGITDMDTDTLLYLDKGLLYQTDIISIRKGERGRPGELTGYIEYLPEYILGVITDNDGKGIYGVVTRTDALHIKEEPKEIGLKQEVTLGEIEIYCTVGEKPDYYSAEITGITFDPSQINRQIALQITDERLLNQTGGIVQGMFTSYNGYNTRKTQ